jgi:ribosome-interacting GTPase 1
MPINASHEYFEAEKKYLKAEGLEDKISCLKEMIRTAPKHKGSENLLAELKTRLKKFLEKLDKGKKIGKGKKGIRKEGFQVVLV